ncbi:MAG: YchJ family metal-binding protein [Pseudomonadota bacterium]
MPCPCGSEKAYEACCGVLHSGERHAATAEDLMRSRYSAFVTANVDYLHDTLWPSERRQFSHAAFEARAKDSIWLGLMILATERGGTSDRDGTVTFEAHSLINGTHDTHREKSFFKKKGRHWYYVKAAAET